MSIPRSFFIFAHFVIPFIETINQYKIKAFVSCHYMYSVLYHMYVCNSIRRMPQEMVYYWQFPFSKWKKKIINWINGWRKKTYSSSLSPQTKRYKLKWKRKEKRENKKYLKECVNSFLLYLRIVKVFGSLFLNTLFFSTFLYVEEWKHLKVRTVTNKIQLNFFLLVPSSKP